MENLQIPTVCNMISSNGNRIANQFIVTIPNVSTIFQSYSSIIVMIKGGITYLDESKRDYSKTTGKYRNKFLGEDKKETEKKIKSGEYILTNLNR